MKNKEEKKEKLVKSFLVILDQKLLVQAINGLGFNNFYQEGCINSYSNLWSQKTRIKFLRIIASEGLELDIEGNQANAYLLYEPPYQEGKPVENLIQAKKLMVGSIWGGDFEYNSIQEYFNIGIITFKNRDTDDKSLLY